MAVTWWRTEWSAVVNRLLCVVRPGSDGIWYWYVANGGGILAGGEARTEVGAKRAATKAAQSVIHRGGA